MRQRKKEKRGKKKEKKRSVVAVEKEKGARGRARNTRKHVCVNARRVFFAATSGECRA